MASKEPISESEEAMPKKKSKGWVWLVVLFLIAGLAFGGYLLLLSKAPDKAILTQTQQSSFLEAQGFDANRLIIPKLSVSEEILSGNASVLDKGIWHRFPERGNPQTEGNTILAGRRYVFSWNPQTVVSQSRFYNLDKLEVGDPVYVNWEGKQYNYTVDEKKTVNPGDTGIEAISSNQKLTLYTCKLNGQADGQVVIIARPKD